MKIAFDAKRAFYNVTGLGNYSRYIINSLISLYPEESYFYFTPDIPISPENVILEKGDYKICLPEGFISKTFSSLWRSSLINTDVKELSPDIYHGLSNEIPSGIQKIGKVKSIVTIHDLIFIRYPQFYNPIDRYIYKKKFLRSCKTADKIIAISKQTKEDIINFFQIEESKIEVHYQDCATGFHQQVSPDSLNQVKLKYELPDQYLLCVGTIEERKNQLLILQALSLIKPEERPFVVLAGKPTAYTDQLRNFIKENQLEKNVKIIEYVSSKYLVALYQGASVFLYTSRFEGFGIPILEALNSGVPVISSKGSCFSEAGGPFSKYVDPDNPEELAENILEVLRNTRLKEEMIREGFKHALTFRKENTIPSLMNLYKSLI